MVSDSELPAEVQSIVSRVVSESRLSQFEKAQVAQELLCHFEDGNQRGRTFSRLIEDFGDPATAAALIRISKLRNRSMMSKLFRGAMYTALVGVVCYASLAAFFHSKSPNPTVDYSVDFNREALAVAEENKAWNVYRDVWAKFEFSNGASFDEIYIKDGDEFIRFVKPSDGELWDIATKKLADSEELLESFRVGGVLPSHGLVLQADQNNYTREDRAALFPKHDPDEEFHLGLGIAGLSEEAELMFSDSMIGMLLPHVQSSRTAARILTVDTRWAMEQGDTERATQNIEAVLGMAHQTTEAPCLVCALVGVAVNSIGYSIIDESMSDGKFNEFSEEQLERIQSAVTKYSVADMFKLDGERISIDDIIQRSYSDDGNGDGRMTAVGFEVLSNLHLWFSGPGGSSDSNNMFVVQQAKKIVAPISMLTMATRKQVTDKKNEMMDEIEARFDIPIYLDDMNDIEEELAELQGIGNSYVLISNVMPAYQQCRSAMFRTTCNQGGVAMAIAAYRYHKKNGEFPLSSEELVGEFLDSVPTDQLNGDPLNYQLTEDGFIVFSVGFDRDNDGGEPIMVTADGEIPPKQWSDADFEAHGKRPQFAGEFWRMDHGPDHVSGDWVIWPRYAEQQDDF